MLAEALLLIYLVGHQPQIEATASAPIASREFSLEDRYGNEFVNNVFKDNILLTLHYMEGDVKAKSDINWAQIEAPFSTKFTLNPGERFVFDNNTLPNYSSNIVKSTNAVFNSTEGYKSDGFLVGDGVCHLASLIYWAAKDAGLSAYAPSNHNFAKINDVPKEYGVAILSTTPMGNLYITNNLDKPITFSFVYNGSDLKVSVLKG